MRRAWEGADAISLSRGGGEKLAWTDALTETPEESQRMLQDMRNDRTSREAWKKVRAQGGSVEDAALQILEDLRDRIQSLPDRVADIVQLSLAVPSAEQPTPEVFAQDVSSAAQDTMSDLGEAIAAASPTAPSYASPEAQGGPEAAYASPESSYADAVSYGGQGAYEMPSVSYAAPEGGEATLPQYASPEAVSAETPDYPSREGVEPPYPEYSSPERVEPPSPDYERPRAEADGGGRDDEMMAMLEGISSRMARQGKPPQGRLPPQPRKASWSQTYTPNEEGYSQGASPSQNVSTIAGAGGASSRRGYGSHGTGLGARYFNPESDVGTPR